MSKGKEELDDTFYKLMNNLSSFGLITYMILSVMSVLISIGLIIYQIVFVYNNYQLSLTNYLHNFSLEYEAINILLLVLFYFFIEILLLGIIFPIISLGLDFLFKLNMKKSNLKVIEKRI